MSRKWGVATAVVVYAAVIAATDIAGTALHSHSASAAVAIPTGACPLLTTVRQDGRAIVTYADDTGDPHIAQAIQTAVSNWNRSVTEVQLVPDPNFAAVLFRAGPRNRKIPTCSSVTARTLVITLSPQRWDSTSGPNAVLDPIASMGRDIGRALGLPEGGKCPDLMSPNACADRNPGPSAQEASIVNELYAPPRTK